MAVASLPINIMNHFGAAYVVRAQFSRKTNGAPERPVRFKQIPADALAPARHKFRISLHTTFTNIDPKVFFLF